MNVFFATRASKTKAYFCVANHVSTLLNHKTHLRAWSLIRRASSPPSPAVREKGKNSRATHVEKLISPLLMLGERSRPKRPKPVRCIFRVKKRPKPVRCIFRVKKMRFGNKKGLGERVDRAFTVLENVRNRNSFSSLEFHNPRALQGVA